MTTLASSGESLEEQFESPGTLMWHQMHFDVVHVRGPIPNHYVNEYGNQLE